MGVLSELRGYVTEDVHRALSRLLPPPSAAALLQNELGSIPPAPFVLGQPATTGPFQISNTVPLVVGDPNVFTGPASSSVQVQNSSGYLISVNTGGASYTIQPFACSTIPTQNRTGATIKAIVPLSNFGNSITLIWMIPGQYPPMSDGPLTQGSTNSLGLLTTTVVTAGGTLTQVLPTPTVGFVYSIFSVTPTYAGGGDYTVDLENGTGSVVYGQANGAATGDTTMMNSLIVPSALAVQALPTVSMSTVIRYDIFPAPIS